MRAEPFRPAWCRIAAAFFVVTVCLTGIFPARAAAAMSQTRHAGASVRLRRKSRPKPPATSAAPACQNGDLMPSAANTGVVDAATLCLVNGARRAAGLAPLTADAALGRAASAHSEDMVAADYFDHVGPDGSDPGQRARAAGFTLAGALVAENLSAATLSAATPAATVAAWMASSGHRANILDPDFRRTGIGVAAAAPAMLGSLPGGTYTEDFA